MKTLAIVLVFLMIFMGLFFLLSVIGLLWIPSYEEIVTELRWFVVYSIGLGWWIAGIAVDEIFEVQE